MPILTKAPPVKPENLAEFVLRKRHERNLSQNEAAKRSGLSNAWFGRLETGTLNGLPKVETLRKLAKGLSVELSELMTVAGYLPNAGVAKGSDQETEQGKTRKPWSHHDFSQASEENKGGEPRSASNELSTLGLNSGETGKQTVNLNGRTGEPGHIQMFPADLGPMKRLPVYRVSCGERVLINDQPEEWQNWPVSWTGPVDGVMVVEGNSMLGAGISPGDRIFFQTINGRRPQPGNIVVAEVDGGAVCKTYKRDADGFEYLSSAPGDEDQQFFARLTDSVRLVGIVVTHIRKM